MRNSRKNRGICFNNRRKKIKKMFSGMLESIDLWLIIGILSGILGGIAHLYQTLLTMHHKISLIPKPYWTINLIASILILFYAIHIRDPLFIFLNFCAVGVNLINIFYYKDYKEVIQNGNIQPNQKRLKVRHT